MERSRDPQRDDLCGDAGPVARTAIDVESVVAAATHDELRRLYGLAGRRLRLLAGKQHAGRPPGRATALAGLGVGERILVGRWQATSRLTSTIKATARRLLDDPSAQWTGRLTNHGVRVERVR